MTGVLAYDIGTGIYILGLVLGLIFGVHYGTTAPWWRTAVGRMFLIITLVLVAAGATVVVQIAVDLDRDAPARLVLRLVGYGGFAVAMGALLLTYLHERSKPLSSLPTRKDLDMTTSRNLVQVDERPAEAGTPTQVANPVRATLRTIVAVLVGIVVALPTINLVLLAVQDELTKATDAGLVIPPWVWIAVNGTLAVLAVITGLITRLLAIPAVNEWVKAHLPKLAAIPLQIED